MSFSKALVAAEYCGLYGVEGGFKLTAFNYQFNGSVSETKTDIETLTNRTTT